MLTSLRLPVVAALGMLVSAAVTAEAQTVYARHAPPGRVVQVVVNRADAGQATVDANGNARVPVDLSALAGKAQMDANVFVDICADTTRIIVVENGRAPLAPNPGCERRDVQGLYAVNGDSNLVVNVGAAAPSMLLIQGSYTPPLPSEEGENGAAARARRPSPTGLVLYTGGAFTSFRDAAATACGDVDGCKARGSGFGFTAGGVYWITPWLGAEGGYIRPKQATAESNETNLQFSMRQKTDVVVIAAKVAAPLGAVRLYGTVGGDYMQATSNTSETIPDKTITVNGANQIVPGGTQTLELKTQGWNYMFGGGLEVWANRALGFYGEFDVLMLKGHPVGSGQGALEDRLIAGSAGIRIRIGGR